MVIMSDAASKVVRRTTAISSGQSDSPSQIVGDGFRSVEAWYFRPNFNKIFSAKVGCRKLTLQFLCKAFLLSVSHGTKTTATEAVNK